MKGRLEDLGRKAEGRKEEVERKRRNDKINRKEGIKKDGGKTR